MDISLVGMGNEVLSLDSMDDYEFSGFEIEASIYKSCPKAMFYRIIDSKLYIMSENISKISPYCSQNCSKSRNTRSHHNKK